MFSREIIEKVRLLSRILQRNGQKISSAESCTGGLFAAAMTDLPGSSEIFERGFVTYSNESKIELLTVPTFFIEDFGAVSKQTAMAMAEGALLISKADIAISVTGIAGPDGGSDEKPVGTVFIGFAAKNKKTFFKEFSFTGSRNSIRNESVNQMLDILLENVVS